MRKNDIVTIIAAIASGLLLTASFPNLDQPWLAWCALVPLLLVVSRAKPGTAFRMGFITGLAHYLTLMYWLAHTMTTYGGLTWLLAVPILFLLTATLALFPGIVAAIVAAARPTPYLSVVLISSVWSSFEFFRSFILTGFPWELLGYSQYRQLPLIQVADITGPYGISFLIVAVNTGLALSITALLRRQWFQRPIRKKVIFAVVFTLVAATATVWVYGNRRIQSIDTLIAAAQTKTFAAIQGNIPQDEKWNASFQQTTTKKYVELSQREPIKEADLIVWPESATPFYLYNHPVLTRLVINGIKSAGTDFLIGSPSYEMKAKVPRYYNSAYLIDRLGQPDSRYDKAHLVPFGEYVPFKQYLPFLGKIVAQVGDFDAGQVGETIPWGGHRIGVLICYELIFPNLARAQVVNGAGVLINLTNDAWYGRTSAPHQHFSTAVFRAVENKRALVRVANTGISGFIDPIGRIVQTTSLFEDAAIIRAVPMLDHLSLYARAGDLFALVCLMASGFLTLFFLILRRRPTFLNR